jgi:molybdenum cofactor cytidylyltransferase
MFTPVDHPNLERSTLEELIGHFKTARASVIVPEFQGQHGHPVLIARPLIAELLALPITAQASDVIRRYRSATNYIAVDDPAVVTDIDDRAAYAELLSHQKMHRP